jgi:hypothetical protein
MFFLLASLFVATVAANGCTSFGGLSHGNSGCVAGEGTPDCAYIQTNAAAICSAILPSWEIVNGPTCNLRGTSYGCVYGSGTFNTQDTFCCVLSGGVVVPAASATSSSSSSPSATLSVLPSVSSSGSPSSSPSRTLSVSPSASSSGSPSSSSSRTLSVSPSASSSGYSSRTASLTASSTASSTTSSTALVVASNTLSPGAYIGIGVGSTLGLLLFCVCIGLCYFRRASASPERRKSVNAEVIAAARRASVTEKKERRPSQLVLRSST